MAIEIVDFPLKNGDFPWQNVSSPEGMCVFLSSFPSSNPSEELGRFQSAPGTDWSSCNGRGVSSRLGDLGDLRHGGVSMARVPVNKMIWFLHVFTTPI